MQRSTHCPSQHYLTSLFLDVVTDFGSGCSAFVLQGRLDNIVHCIDHNPGQTLNRATPDFPLDCPTGLQPISYSVDCCLAHSERSLNSRVLSTPVSRNVLMARRSSSL